MPARRNQRRQRKAVQVMAKVFSEAILASRQHPAGVTTPYHRRRRQDARAIDPIEYETLMTAPATQAA